MADHGRDGETTAEESGGTRERFLAMSRFEGNVERSTPNVQLSIQKMIEH
jgi:hypothetical protein